MKGYKPDYHTGIIYYPVPALSSYSTVYTQVRTLGKYVYTPIYVGILCRGRYPHLTTAAGHHSHYAPTIGSK